MPKKPVSKSSPSKSSPSKAPAPKATPAATFSRNTPVPRPAAKREITHEMVAKRAFEIHISGKGGSQTDNWFRAERELKAGL
jgi:hypothetical protein